MVYTEKEQPSLRGSKADRETAVPMTSFAVHFLPPSSPGFAKLHPIPSSPGFAQQIIRGSKNTNLDSRLRGNDNEKTLRNFAPFAVQTSHPSSRGLTAGSIRKKIPACAGMTALKLGGPKKTLCSLLNSVTSVVRKTAGGITKQPQMHSNKHEWRHEIFGFIRVYSWLKTKDPSTALAYTRFAQDDKKYNAVLVAAVAVHFLTSSSRGLTAGSIKQKDPSTSCLRHSTQDDNGCLRALGVLGGSKNPLCPLSHSVTSVAAPPPPKSQGNKLSNSNFDFKPTGYRGRI